MDKNQRQHIVFHQQSSFKIKTLLLINQDKYPEKKG